MKMRGSRSQHDLHASSRDLPARALHGPAFGGIPQQRRVGVVDMQKNLSADSETIERRDRTVIARHRDMSHRPSGLAAEPASDQFIVAPHRAGEKHQRFAADTPPPTV